MALLWIGNGEMLHMSLTILAPANRGPGVIDGLLVPPGKASNLLTDHLITG